LKSLSGCLDGNIDILGACFSDLCDFSDPLNSAAAEELRKDEMAFQRKVQALIQQHAS